MPFVSVLNSAPGSRWRPPECLVVLEDLLLEDPVRHAVVRVGVLPSLSQLLILRRQRVYWYKDTKIVGGIQDTMFLSSLVHQRWNYMVEAVSSNDYCMIQNEI